MKFLLLVIVLFLHMGLRAQDDTDELIKQRQETHKDIIETQKALNQINPNDEYDIVIEKSADEPEQGNGYIALPESKEEELNDSILSNLKSKYLPQLKQNPLANKDTEEVRERITTKVKGTNWEILFHEYPKILNFVVDLLSHEDAFVRLVSILSKPDKLAKYFWCFVVVMIVVIYWNYKLPKHIGFFKKLTRRLIFYIGSLAINITSFYLIFRFELGPTVTIFIKNFL